MPVSEAFRVAKGGFTSLAGEIDNVARAGVAALRRQLTALTDRVTAVEVLPAVCQLSMSAVQEITDTTVTAVSFDTEDLDTVAWHAGGAPTLVTPTIAGWYEANVDFEWESDGDYTRRFVEIQKNSASLTPLCRHDLGSGVVPTGVESDSLSSRLISMNGSSDTLRVVAYQVNTSAAGNDLRAVFTVKLVEPT